MVDSIRLIMNDFKIDTDRCEKLSWDQNIYNYNKCNGDRCICNKTYGKEFFHGYNLKVKGDLYFINEYNKTYGCRFPSIDFNSGCFIYILVYTTPSSNSNGWFHVL